jgi:hypothetical protein
MPYTLLKFCYNWVADFVSTNHSTQHALSCAVTILKETKQHSGWIFSTINSQQTRMPIFLLSVENYCIQLVSLFQNVQVFNFVTLFCIHLYFHPVNYHQHRPEAGV